MNRTVVLSVPSASIDPRAGVTTKFHSASTAGVVNVEEIVAVASPLTTTPSVTKVYAVS